MGGSAGGYLSLMMAMTPPRMDDGGPTPELRGVSPSVCGAFAWIAPTDFEAFWQQGPSDASVDASGKTVYRHWDDAIPNDARPHLRFLFHGMTPETAAGAALYRRLSPVNLVRRGLPPLLICDGRHDAIVPGQEGQDLYRRLQAAGADAQYWISEGGHEYPSGQGFAALLSAFLDKLFKTNN
jgi:dipeptidyl aminopeptidase/acylaminoacyl peptidase